jgi:hypothetical protein
MKDEKLHRMRLANIWNTYAHSCYININHTLVMYPNMFSFFDMVRIF